MSVECDGEGLKKTMTDVHRYRNFIGGRWVASSSGETLPNINPADGRDVLGLAPLSTETEAQDAIEAAKEAAPGWRRVPGPARGDILLAASRNLKEHAEDLARMITLEEGKAIGESRQEAAKAARVFEYMAGAGRRLGGVSLPSAFPKNLAYTIREPLGVVALITPWNFPVSIPAWKMAPALVSGNTVVFKPASLVPGSAEMLVQILIDSGFPDGVLNLIYGSGGKVGNAILEHPSLAGVSFTGSNQVGSGIYQRCGEQDIPAQCEMGGKNPCIILEDADLDLAIGALIGGAFGATGQRCTAMSRAIVIDSIADKFIEKLLERTRRLKVGPGIEDDTFMGPCVSESQMNSVLEYVELGKAEGGHLLIGGTRLMEAGYQNGFFLAPVIFDYVSPSMRIAREEIFGPVLSVLRVPDFEAAMEAANNVDFGLTSVIYTRDLVRALEFVERIEAGMAHVNSPWLGGEVHFPFGGTKASTVGAHEMGEEALSFFTQTKAVYINYKQP